MTKQKVIIDCDPGIDDSLALMYAIQHPKLEVLAITVVAGNVPTPIGIENTFKILERLGRTDIPVYAGAEKPLSRDFVSAQDTHGMDGLGETHIKRTTQITAQAETAADFLAKHFSRPRNTSIIALGPLTNIARALSSEPNLGKHCHRFVSMGGSYKSNGNCSPVAEYNYWCDPHAAKIVFASLEKKVEMVGLDVTRSIVLTPNLLEYMSFINQDEADFIRKITRFYWDFHWQYEHIIGCVINDPLAVAYFINSELCQGFNAYVDIATEGIALGQSIVDDHHFYKRKANAHVLTQVKSRQFFEDFLSVVLHAETSIIAQDLEQLQLG